MRGLSLLLVVGSLAACGVDVGDSETFPGLGSGTPTDGDSTSGGDSGDDGDGDDGNDEDTDDDDDDDSGSETGVGDPCGDVTCDPNAQCIDNECECDEGWLGDGIECIDPDDCDVEPCYPGVDCMDVPSPGTGYICAPCPEGYEGDGEECFDADGCVGDPCFPAVDCTDVPAPGIGFVCGDCPTGYEGDGETCDDIDGCAGDPCYTGVACDDVPAPGEGFECGDCPAGLYGDGAVCEEGTLYVIGDTPTSGNLGPYFRGNGYVADADGALIYFEVYLGLAAACNLDFYVFEGAAPGAALSQVWRNTVAAGAGTQYRNSGVANVPITDGNYYVLGVGWNCSATYYWNNASAWVDYDAGIGIFTDNRWDNSYPGPSDMYTPPGTGTPSTTYPHQILWAGP
jgi:hypothetical protein